MSRKEKPRVGRPPYRRRGQVKGAIFSIRLSPADRQLVERAAEAAGHKASDWARGLIVQAASGDGTDIPATRHGSDAP